MATVLSTGKQVQIQQWCNDWFSTDDEDHGGGIYSPTELRLDPEEMAAVLESRNRHSLVGGPACGTLFVEFEPHEDGTWTRKMGPTI